jgi:hypothetical protein
MHGLGHFFDASLTLLVTKRSSAPADIISGQEPAAGGNDASRAIQFEARDLDKRILRLT